MRGKFTIVIERKGDEYVAQCREIPGVGGRGQNMQATVESIRAAIIKRLDEGPDDGSAQVPHPEPPSPHGPIIVEESHEEPRD